MKRASTIAITIIAAVALLATSTNYVMALDNSNTRTLNNNVVDISNAENSVSDDTFTPEKRANLVTNCTAIKSTLTRLERSDSRTRTYLGALYETVLNSFINPLELRLSRLGRSDEAISSLANEYKSSQATFREAYTNYMREMDVLIATDCISAPEDFYNQLVNVRGLRRKLRESTDQMKSLVNKQIEAVTNLRSTLWPKNNSNQ